MTDVFISYSRRDKVFTQKLVDALKTANRDVWADWDSIPAASDWDAEIKEGIEKTNTVLFLLSPEWLKSNECRKELEHALKMGKRLLPILYLMPDQGQEVPPELAKINWVYMRDTDNFDKAFETLQSAMDTDLDWIKTHTRIQVRAVEWDKKKRDNSFTLRGQDLTDGEQFNAESANKSPAPTTLQGEYILASRKDATRRQRITLAGVSVALVVSIALGILAYFQWQTADLNAKIATSRELVASASTNLDTDPELSALLALESVKVLQDANQPISSETQTAVRTALAASRLRYVEFDEATSALMSLEFSPDGSLIAASYYDGRVEISRIGEIEIPIGDTGWHTKSIGLQPDKSLPNLAAVAWDVEFSPDGKQIVTAVSDQDLNPAVWDVETGKLLFILSGHSGFVRSVEFNPDGTRIATAGEDGTVRVWDASNGSEIVVISDHALTKGQFPEFNWVYALAFSPDGKALASAGGDQSVIISNSETGELIKTIEPARFATIYDLEFSPDGSKIAWADDRGYINVVDLLSNTRAFISADTTMIKGVAFSPDGNTLAGAGIDGVVTLLNPNDGSIQLKLNSSESSDITSISYSPDNKYIATGTLKGNLLVWDVSKNGGGEVNLPADHSSPISGLSFNPKGGSLTSTSIENGAQVLDFSSAENLKKEMLFAGTRIEGLSFSADGTKAVFSNGGSASLYDVTTWGKISDSMPINYPGLYLFAVALSPDGKLIAGGLSSSDLPLETEGELAIIWDAQTGVEVKTLLFKSRQVHAVAFSPDGKLFAAGGDDATVKIAEINGSAEPITLSGHTDWLRAVNFSPDNKWLVSAGYDRNAIVWDAATGDQKMLLEWHTAVVNDAKFSPDGSLIALASGDGVATIWDSETGELLYRITPQAGELTKLEFSPDGKLIAIGANDGGVRTYFLDFNISLALTQNRITRSLYDLECSLYLHQNPCPETIAQPQPRANGYDLISLIPIPKATGTDDGFKSGSGTIPVELKIINNADKEIKLNWVNFDGVEQDFATILAGEDYFQGTSNTHAWRIRDSGGNLLFEFIATDQAIQEITINADLTVTVK